MTPGDTILTLYRRIDAGDFTGARALLAPSFRLTSTVHPEPMDADAWLGALALFDAAFSDVSHGTVVDAENGGEDGGEVRGRFHVSGRHTGHLSIPGLAELAPTGKAFRLPAEPFAAHVHNGLVERVRVTMAPNGGYKAVLAQLRGEAEPAPLAPAGGEEPAA